MKKITLLFSLLISSFVFSQIVTNGNFQTGTSAPWYNGAANVVDLGGMNYVNQANVLVAGPAYDVNLSQIVSLTSGMTYELKFDAFTDSATGSRTMIVGLGQSNVPYTALTSTTTLTSTSQTFTYQYTINYGEAVTDRVIFDMGAATGYVFIDNVSVTQVVSTCNNGIQDGTETGIDCGGSCPPCIAAPTTAAPTPPARPAADVICLFSEAYANIPVTQWSADFDDSNISDVSIVGNATKKIDFTNFLGVILTNYNNATSMTHFHMDYWIPNETDLTGKVLNPKLSNHAAQSGETSALLLTNLPTVKGSWASLDAELSTFTPQGAGVPFARQAVKEFLITSNLGTVYVDNIYLHKNTLATTSFKNSNVKLFPNPANTNFTIQADATIEKVGVYNLLGQEVISQTPNNTSVNVSISDLEVGVYLVKTTIDGAVSSTRIIKE